MPEIKQHIIQGNNNKETKTGQTGGLYVEKGKDQLCFEHWTLS